MSYENITLQTIIASREEKNIIIAKIQNQNSTL